MKKVLQICGALIIVMLISRPAAAAPNIIIDGQKLSFDVPPAVENGRTLVPLRAIFEALAANVSWDNTTQTVTATKGDISIKIKSDSQIAYRNNQLIFLEVPSKMIKNRTMVPIRFVSEALGAKVDWNNTTQTISIAREAASAVSKTLTPADARNALQGKGIAFDEASFFDYLNKGDNDTVNLFLEAGMNPNVKDQYETTALMNAAGRGYLDIVVTLLNSGADVNATTSSGHSALMGAVNNGGIDIVKVLIAKGADVNAKYVGKIYDGKTALMWAAEKGYSDIVTLLINNGADINAKDSSGKDAVYYATYGGQPNIIKLLGAKIGGNDNYIKTASRVENARNQLNKMNIPYNADNFTKYVLKGNGDVSRLFLEVGMDPNQLDGSIKPVLMLAAMSGNIDIAKDLIDRGANVNSKDLLLKTPLMEAADNRHFDIVKLLIDKGANVTTLDNLGQSALHYSVDSVDIINCLIDKGLDVNLKNRHGYTPLFIAAWWGCTDGVKTLLENGADPNIKGNNGNSPLTIAEHYKETEIIKMLKDAGARP